MKPQQKRKYYLFDAQGKILGRSAVRIAEVLSGKRKRDFAPNVDGGDFVVVVRTDGFVTTGKKGEQKMYHHWSGYPGGITSISLKDQMKKDSRRVLKNAVFGMLPKNKLRDCMMRRLLMYQGSDHTHTIDETLTF